MDRSKSNGRKSACKSCDAARAAGYYAAHRDRIAARAAAAARARRPEPNRPAPAADAPPARPRSTAVVLTGWVAGRGQVEVHARAGATGGFITWCPRCGGALAPIAGLRLAELCRPGLSAADVDATMAALRRDQLLWPAEHRCCTGCGLHIELDPLPPPPLAPVPPPTPCTKA